MATGNELQTIATDAEISSHFFNSDEEKSAFPTIDQFLSEHRSSGQQGADIDIVRFFSDRRPEFEKGVHSSANRLNPIAGDGTAEIFIVEAIDPHVAEFFLENRVGVNRTSFLQFLEDFLDGYSSYDFDDMQNHFQPRKSLTTRQRHVCFQVMCLREFDCTPELDRNGLFKAAEAKTPAWKDVRLHGLLMPAQREVAGKLTTFPPCVLSRNHFAAWFDGDTSQGWQTGMPPIW